MLFVGGKLHPSGKGFVRGRGRNKSEHRCCHTSNNTESAASLLLFSLRHKAHTRSISRVCASCPADRVGDRPLHSTVRGGGPGISAVSAGVGVARQRALLVARLGIGPSRKVFPRVKAAAEKALEIEDLPEARTALAAYHLFYEHDCNAAEANLCTGAGRGSRMPARFGWVRPTAGGIGKA